MRLTRSVYLLSGPPYGLHQNAYAIDTGERLVLIDTGWGGRDYERMMQSVAEWGLSGRAITHALITHAHFDHSGNAHRFYAAGAEVFAGDIDAQGIELGDDRTIAYTYSAPFTPCPKVHPLKDGDEILVDGIAIRAIHVPGHSRGSMAYLTELDDRRVLFTGDFVLPGGDLESAQLGFTGGQDFDPAAYIRSLDRIRKVPADLVLGGHNQPCLTGGQKVLNLAYTFALTHWRYPGISDRA